MLKHVYRNMKDVNSVSRIGVIGGGPAGLSIAYMLKDQGFQNVTVFEAQEQVGGKSFTVKAGDQLVEMGTCYATFAHHITNKWMQQLNMPMQRLGDVFFEGGDFIQYVRSGSGAPLPVQLLKYLNAKARLEKALKKRPIPRWALDEAAQPIQDWLRARDLGKIECFMHRSTTNIAYGFVDEVSTLQALRWNDLNLIGTGFLKQLKLPVDGWAEFWRRLAQTLDVRLSTPIIRIDRDQNRHRLTTKQGDMHDCDLTICAIPVDEFSELTDVTENECFVRDSVEWNGYATTLFTADNWFTDYRVDAFKNSVLPGAELGQLLSARYDGYDAEIGGHLYLAGQLSGTYSHAELKELLRNGVAERGGAVTNIILQKVWKYHAQYKRDAIRDGLLSRLESMQGERNTWYTGATFSHEVVSHIVNFNANLAKQIKLRNLTTHVSI